MQRRIVHGARFSGSGMSHIIVCRHSERSGFRDGTCIQKRFVRVREGGSECRDLVGGNGVPPLSSVEFFKITRVCDDRGGKSFSEPVSDFKLALSFMRNFDFSV